MKKRDRVRGIIICIVVMATVELTLGVSWPLLAIALERQGVPAWLNGVSASAQMLAILAVPVLSPRLIGRFSTVGVLAISLVGMAVSLALLPVFPNVWAWFPIRFCLGLSTELAFAAGDIWINQLATERARGRIIGIFGMFAQCGFALGPLAIAMFGSDNWSALYLVVAACLVALIALRWARGAVPAIKGKPRARLLHFLRVAPTLLVAGLMFGIIGSLTMSLMTVYGIEKGLAADSAALLLTMFAIGTVIGQLPIGWLADHMDRRHLLGWCVAITMLMYALLPVVIGDLLLIRIMMLVMGVALGGFYVLALAMMGQRFQGAELVGINASYIVLFGLGAVIGPSLGGGAIGIFGADGMPAVGTGLCALFLAMVIWRIRAVRHEPVA